MKQSTFIINEIWLETGHDKGVGADGFVGMVSFRSTGWRLREAKRCTVGPRDTTQHDATWCDMHIN